MCVGMKERWKQMVDCLLQDVVRVGLRRAPLTILSLALTFQLLLAKENSGSSAAAYASKVE